jgi:hypothetical protein
VLPALAVRRLRPFALAFGLQALLVLRPGYLPQPYVVAVLPFAALVVAGVADQLAAARPARLAVRLARPVAALALAVAAAATVPVWVRADHAQLTRGSDVEAAQAVAWLRTHVSGDKRIIVDDNVWLDLVRGGYDPNPPYSAVVWVYKIGTDPSVKLPEGPYMVDYFVYAMPPIYAARDVPQIVAPYRNSKVVATFGHGDNRITVRKVIRRR